MFSQKDENEKNIIELEQDIEIKNKINRLINQLPAKQKEAVYLRFNEGFVPVLMQNISVIFFTDEPWHYISITSFSLYDIVFLS